MLMTNNKLVNVLIVEDYKLTRMGLNFSLSEVESIKVIGDVDSAEKALEFIQEKRPDVVLMDLGLPGMNGIEATKKIKDLDESIKVIILTSHEREKEMLAAIAFGANAYFLKDITPDTLVNVIKSVDKGAVWVDPTLTRAALDVFPKPENNQLGLPAVERAHLSEREMEVLRLVVEGKSNTEIAKELFVSVHTAKAHVCNILQKLCVDDRVQAAVKAIKENIV